MATMQEYLEEMARRQAAGWTPGVPNRYLGALPTSYAPFSNLGALWSGDDTGPSKLVPVQSLVKRKVNKWEARCASACRPSSQAKGDRSPRFGSRLLGPATPRSATEAPTMIFQVRIFKPKPKLSWALFFTCLQSNLLGMVMMSSQAL